SLYNRMPLFLEAAAGAFERWTTTIARNLVAEGWPERAARTAAVAMLSIVEGALLLARTAGDTEALSAAAGTLRTVLGARRPSRRKPELGRGGAERSTYREGSI